MTPDLDALSPTRLTITLVGVMVSLAVVLWRNQKPRKLRIELLWIRPLLFSLVVMAALYAYPVSLTPIGVAVLVLALDIGVALGWQRGRLMRIDIDPVTHAVTSKASPMAMAFIAAILVLRTVLRDAMVERPAWAGIPAALLTDALVLLMGAMVTVQSLEMWLRARKGLADARENSAQ